MTLIRILQFEFKQFYEVYKFKIIELMLKLFS